MEIEENSYRYIVGIDLGTTNSALAFLDRRPESQAAIRFFPIPQLVAPAEWAERPILPSFLYLPGPYDLPPESTALPWDGKRAYAVGEFAREQGALVPGRLVSSAKSWLCHGGVDRTAPILPWGSTEGEKVSPLEASSRYLQHMREAWNDRMARGNPESRLEEQLIILTVPASFDEVARELTIAAARQAGLGRIVLLEEPLAAFYSWLSRHETDWRERMGESQLVLVCDVGGGTTDFTVVASREGEKGLRFDRLAVGEHLMLGGDNMDLALARHLEGRMLGKVGQLDSKRWHQLWHHSRRAKELLLDEDLAHQKNSVDITVTGAGGKLIGESLRGSLTSSEVKQLIIEGFFPSVPFSDLPRGGIRRGLTEWGLPYVQDPAVTRHLAAFWQRFHSLLQKETGRDSPYPDFLLFNGGALTPASIRRRLREVVRSWFRQEAGEGWAPVELDNPRPELSVALGAAYYGLVRLGAGVRVGAGSPRAYYVQVAPEQEKMEDFRVVCLVPRGTEEGFRAELAQPSFQALTNQPASFRLFTSSTRLGDRMGDVVELGEEEAVALPPIRTVLRFGKGAPRLLPVKLAVHLTEIGTLELWCQSQQTAHRWQLQFDVRQEGEPQAVPPGETLDLDLTERAKGRIRAVFRGAEGGSPPPERLVRDLVSVLELGKEKWPASLIRRLADALLESKAGRTLAPGHEARWLNLSGFCLRPGFGDLVDEWRMKEVWKIYLQGLVFPRQAQNRSEWWIFWRRVAGGLTAGQQQRIYQDASAGLPGIEGKRKKKPKFWSAQEELEIWMMMANLERLPASLKEELGERLLAKIRQGRPRPQEIWALSRFGARIPLYGPLDLVVSPTQAGRWLRSLLELDLEASEAAARPLIHLARRTGDRERDLPEEERELLSAWLERVPQGQSLRQRLERPSSGLEDQEQDWTFGETLPSGLILSGG